MTNRIKGTGVAIVTPFRKHGTVDFSALERIIQHNINGGVDFIVTLGTTSETATLSTDERRAVVDFIRDTVDNRVPIVMGMGGNNTQEVIDNISQFDFNGIDAILSVGPFYNKPSQKGIYMHFKHIANASPVPVILYNVPSRTGQNIDWETIIALANDCDNIMGIKEASGDFNQCMNIIKNRPEGFLFFSGDDLRTLPLMSIGSDGVISVIANAFPSEFSQMVNAAHKGNYIKARNIHYDLLEIIELIFADGNPGGIKAALEILGLCTNNLRLPLVKVNKSVYIQLNTKIKEFQSKISE